MRAARFCALLALADAIVPPQGLLRGRVHVVLDGGPPAPVGCVQVALGTGETEKGGWGDGAHPSTAMCLEWLSELTFAPDDTFLDYGCGSGVPA